MTFDRKLTFEFGVLMLFSDLFSFIFYCSFKESLKFYSHKNGTVRKDFVNCVE